MRDGNVRGSAEEVFNRVKHPRNNTKFLRKVAQYLDNGTVVEVDTVNLSMAISNPYFPNNVLNIRLSGLEGIQRTKIITLGFDQLKNHGVDQLEVRLLDSGLLTSRPLISLGHFYGDSILFGTNSSGYYEHLYSVILEQTKFLEEDVSKNCVNYPTENHITYQHCDDSFQKEFLEKHSPYKPFWAFGQLNKNEPNVPYLKELRFLINLLFAGSTKSTCPLPCTTNVAETELMYKQEGAYGCNWISCLPDEVRMTETLFVETSVGQVLSDIGGTLGLWLGLGVLQLFQSIASIKCTMWQQKHLR